MQIYLITKPAICDTGLASFLADHAGDPDAALCARSEPDAIVETAGRLCYASFGKGRRDIGEYIRNLIDSGHGSVFEHVTYGVIITGVSRSLTHELVRHRAGFAYSQRSQRYVNEAVDPFDAEAETMPPLIQAHPELQDGWRACIDDAYHAYDELLYRIKEAAPEASRKQRLEAARSVLPNAASTQIFVTANVRAWRHFITLRSAPSSDAEMRELAQHILLILKMHAPLMFGDLECQ